MKLYRTTQGIFVEHDGNWFPLAGSSWTELVTRDDLPSLLESKLNGLQPAAAPAPESYLAPLEGGEVWAAGVTYFRSRTARMEESKAAGGGSFYDRVYEAERPELFFKATPSRTVNPGASVHIRADSAWNVPEPELALVVTPSGRLIGYTIGNDMSSRDIEGENPLYLPQAKVYQRSCALGPCLLVTGQPLPPETPVSIAIVRAGQQVFGGATRLSEMKRRPDELIAYLFREDHFPAGCILLTGTGVIPPDEFTLAAADRIEITIPPIGTLVNSVD